jgi:tetratricopeptide (TPR) repeat protein
MSSTPSNLRTRWERMRQHGAFQAAIVFASGSWLVVQAADIFGLPSGAVRALGVVLFSVFAVLTAVAWIGAGRAEEGAGHPPTDPAEDAESPTPAPPRRLRGRLVAAIAVVLLLAGFGAWWATPRLFGSVRPGADVIAVLPFTTSGPSVELLGEGMVDLLSTNLDEVGAIRTIDPRTVLHRWRQVAVDGSLDQEGALRLGRTVDASSVLLGSVVEAGGPVRLSAELIGVDGTRLARAQVSGAAESVLALVDALSIALLREIWRGREPVPQLRLAAITTESPAALRAFLRGERFYRASQWDSARASFEAAIALDSTFALAHMRLGEVYGWSERLGSESARRQSATAERFADRLPARERTLVVAHRLHEEGDASAADSLTAYAARHPDDAVALQMLGDVRLHAAWVLGVPVSEILEPFEAAQRLDPTYAPAYQHPLEIALAIGDSTRFQRYRTARAAIEPAGGVGYYDTLAALRWGSRESRLELFEAAVRRRGPEERLYTVFTVSLFDDNAPSLGDALAALDVFAEALPGGPDAIGLGAQRAWWHMLFGRFRDAVPLLEPAIREYPGVALFTALPAMLGGLAPAEIVEPLIAFLEGRASDGSSAVLFWRATIALAAGDTARVRALLDGGPSDERAGVLAEGFEVLRGLYAVALGDTTRGVRTARNALRRMPYGPQTASFVLALDVLVTLVEATRPELRERTAGHLDLIAALRPDLAIVMHEAFARAYETAGRPDRAADIYARFLRFYANADPEFQPYVDAARRELERLAADGAARRAS